MKQPLEAAAFYAEAGDLYMKIDLGEALQAIRSSISIYCDLNMFDVAAKLERKIAYIHLQSKHWEDASIHFRKSANFFFDMQLIDQSDICLGKAATCLIEEKEYLEAARIYEIVAEGCAQSNLRKFSACDYHLKAALCLLAVNVPPPLKRNGKIDMTRPPPNESKMNYLYERLIYYGKVDFMWKTSKEEFFIRNVVQSRLDADRADFIDHVYWWNNIRPLDKGSILCLKVVMKEIEAEEIRKVAFEEGVKRGLRRREERRKKEKIRKRIMGEEVSSSSEEEEEQVDKDGKVVPKRPKKFELQEGDKAEEVFDDSSSDGSSDHGDAIPDDMPIGDGPGKKPMSNLGQSLFGKKEDKDEKKKKKKRRDPASPGSKAQTFKGDDAFDLEGENDD
jgi:hypothetical protein